jgi:hypothetical protein
MVKNNSPANFIEVLQSVQDLTLEDEGDVLTKPLEQVQAKLKADGINVSPLIKKVQQALAQDKAKAALAKAHEEYERLLNLSRSRSTLKQDRPKLSRDEMIKLLLARHVDNPASTGVYFHKFEEASDADLERMLDDWDLLNEINKGSCNE